VIINGKTKVYGIIGNPVSHSLSPVMHNAAFVETGLNCCYLPFKTDNVEAAIQGIKHLDICGVSVTIPHKQTVIPFLDSVDETASKIGSVNTIKCIRDQGKVLLHGLNTDWLGANRALQEKIELAGSRVVIVGAGGAARAIGFGLLQAKAEIILCSRTESRGKKLASELGCDWLPLVDIGDKTGECLLNATSVGMSPNEEDMAVPAEILENFQVVMDIVYAPLNTALLQAAKSSGCKIINGLEMLLYQGAAQFEIWNELAAPVEQMRKALLHATGNVYS